MKLILLQDVRNIGRKGEIVSVNDGYARNFILPRKLGKIATQVDEKLQQEQTKHKKELDKKRADAYNQFLDEINDLEVSVSVKANTSGRLFSALKESEIISAVENSLNRKIPKELLIYKDKIKETGISELLFQFEKKKSHLKINVIAK